MRVPRPAPGQVFDPLFQRRERLFVVGAGFSVTAGLPLTPELMREAMDVLRGQPTGAAAAARIDAMVARAFRLESRPDYGRLAMHEVCTLLNYYELCEVRFNYGAQWRPGVLPQLLALRFAIAKVIAKRTPPQPAGLIAAFVRQLRPGDVIVSFNWDCLLEVAMHNAAIEWSYGGQTGVRLLKMHGSVNWRRSDPKRFPALDDSWKEMPFDQPDDRLIQWNPDLFCAGERWDSAVALALPLTIDPLLVLPGYGKAFDIRDVADLWSLPNGPGSPLLVKGDVFVVGLSLARDDFIIQAFFRDTLQHIENDRRIVIINPDPLALDNYSFLVGRPNVSFLCHPFGEEDVLLMEQSASDERWQHELPRGSTGA